MHKSISIFFRMIQDIFPHRFSNLYRTYPAIGENDYILHYHENSLLLKTEGESYEIPRKKDFPEITGQTEYVFLFTLDEVPCFLVWDELKANRVPFVYQEITSFRTLQQQEIAWILMAGFHLLNWYGQNRYCGKCGTKTHHKPDERALVCPGCQNVIYPKISPAIIVAIVCGNNILLARGSNFRGSWYSLIAGYADVGESLEDTVKREVKEEVGLDVRNIRYYKSQPWPLSGSMMIGFVAEADDHQPVSVDRREIAEAAWFTRGRLPEYSMRLSIAGEMIEKFDKGEL